jgi:hypothetical protein
VPTSFAERIAQLESYLRAQVRLDTPLESNGGKTRRQTITPLLKMYEGKKMKGKLYASLVEELHMGEKPQGSDYLLSIFYELCSYRQYGMAGQPLPLSLLDIKAYSELIQPLEDWEIRAIRRLDDAVRHETNLLKDAK